MGNKEYQVRDRECSVQLVRVERNNEKSAVVHAYFSSEHAMEGEKSGILIDLGKRFLLVTDEHAILGTRRRTRFIPIDLARQVLKKNTGKFLSGETDFEYDPNLVDRGQEKEPQDQA